MTFTSVSTATYTRTHTATHLADVILGSIADILGTLGIDVTQVFADWDRDQQAIAAWIAEGSLACVALECHQSNGAVSPIFEFPVLYVGTGEGDRKFTADRAALARYLAKLQTVPAGTVYRIFCSYTGSHSSQPGWGPAARAALSGLRSYSFGTLAAGPHASAGLRYFTK
jgi:hypothetical protein